MKTRMRYKKTNGLLTNADKLYDIYNRELIVQIKGNTLEITCIEGKTKFNHQNNNVNILKQIAKAILKDMGVKFENEIRPKKKKKKVS
jgi:hypothetical protein